MDYYQKIRSDMVRKVMYPVDHRKDYIPKREDPSKVKIEPKAPCVPSFVSPIEGNAVEEGARIFFEGIVDAQPHPNFMWYFEDELIVPGKPGWEEAEIHHSRKMSTLIIRYTREYHMGRFSLLAKNELGYDVCSCDLIVRKKQFPPVFWKRLINTTLDGGSRYVMEVEVGGWPIPDVYWYRNDEMIVPKIVSENYNHYFNAYVPEKKIEIVQIDQIRHAIIISRLSASDQGKYTVYAKNAIGEAVCEADIDIDEGDNCYSSEDLFLPDAWRTGKRLTWKDEDARNKKFVGKEDPELTDEDIRDMTKRVSGTPLPRSLEYLASLPDYKPDRNALKNLIPMNFKPDPGVSSKLQTKKAPVEIRRPSKFVPGTIIHRGYKCDKGDKMYPVWRSSLMKNQPRRDYKYSKVNYPSFPKNDAKRYPKELKDPPCPHVWESHDKIDELYRILGEMRERDRSESTVPPYSKKKLDKKNAAIAKADKTDSPRLSRKDSKKVHFEESEHAKKWSEVLDQNVPGSQSDAEQFTKEFIKELSGSVIPDAPKPPQMQKADQKVGTHSNYLSRTKASNENVSRQLQPSSASKGSSKRIQESGLSPLESTDESSSTSAQTVFESTQSFKSSQQFKTEISQIVKEQVVTTTSGQDKVSSERYHEYVPIRYGPGKKHEETAMSQSEVDAKKDSQEFIPVRDKVRMIAQQHEEILKKEEQMRGNENDAFVPGGVRILPPSPVTVRKDVSSESERLLQQEFYTFSESKMSSSSQVHVNKASFAANNEEDSSLAQDESTLDISRHSYAGTETSEAQYSDTSKEDSMIIYPDEEEFISPLAKSLSFVQVESNKTKSNASSASAPSTPQNSRRVRTKSEMTEQHEGPLSYRTPPKSPFQPSFYKPPPKEDPAYLGSHQPVFRQIKRFTKKRPPKDTGGRFSDSEN